MMATPPGSVSGTVTKRGACIPAASRLEWPQVATVLAAIGAVIGTGLPILDIFRPRDDKPSSEDDRP